jgi:2-keto-4-pentenoate hydratase/2-oxohepta-3-ene-1,7-dioic acid hydratase in catechol pathway
MQMGSYGVCPYPVEDSNLRLAFVRLPLRTTPLLTMASFASTGKKIVAIGRNYAKHARELGNAIPEKPFFFLKPTTSYVHSPGKVEIPRGTIVHHESRGQSHFRLCSLHLAECS